LKLKLSIGLILLGLSVNAYAEPAKIENNAEDIADMVIIPAGKFSMGRGVEVSDGKSLDEQPAHEVDLDAYYIDKYEITNAQYEKFDPNHPRSNLSAYDQSPVTNVSWGDAQKYCNWVKKRLPSEAEWEKAARGPKNYSYATGEVYNPKLANTGRIWTAGIYDMMGNVWEWCNDWYAADYYQHSPAKNPTGPSSGECRVLRGGAWNTQMKYAHATNRYYDIPSIRFHSFGFRCAKGSQETK
jgi:formylglycine-generating enzyme required for sulfatase activity